MFSFFNIFRLQFVTPHVLHKITFRVSVQALITVLIYQRSAVSFFPVFPITFNSVIMISDSFSAHNKVVFFLFPPSGASDVV